MWLWALAAVFGWSLLRQGVRPFLERLFESPANHAPGDGGHSHGHHHGHAHVHEHPAEDDTSGSPAPNDPPPGDGGCCGGHGA